MLDIWSARKMKLLELPTTKLFIERTTIVVRHVDNIMINTNHKSKYTNNIHRTYKISYTICRTNRIIWTVSKNPTFPWHTVELFSAMAPRYLRNFHRGWAVEHPTGLGVHGGNRWSDLGFCTSHKESKGRRVGWLVYQYLCVIVAKYTSSMIHGPWIFVGIFFFWLGSRSWSCIFTVGRHGIPWYMRGISIKASLMWYVLYRYNRK